MKTASQSSNHRKQGWGVVGTIAAAIVASVCCMTVAASLRQVPGVVDAQATLDPPQAMVTFDPDQATLDDLVQATTNAGYPSSPKEKDQP